MKDEIPITSSSGCLTFYPRLAINLDKVLYAKPIGEAGHVEVAFEDREETLVLTAEEAGGTCFASLRNFPDRTAIGHKG